MKRCLKCWEGKGKDLWETCCYCTGSIPLKFSPPGILSFDPEPSVDQPVKKVKESKKKSR